MARLPPEVILLIFKVSDQKTLIAWCEATIGSAFLHAAAIQECWNEVEIDVEDLTPSPEELGDDTEFARYYKHNLDPSSKLNQAVKYAHHIRKLDVNLTIGHTNRGKTPTYETSVYSAKLLLPAAVNIEILCFDGPVSKEIYNSVKEIPKLRKLVIGRRNSSARMRDSKNLSYRGHWPPEQAKWILPMLEEYENYQFWNSYAHNYLLTSKRLQRVYINILQPYEGYESLVEENYHHIQLRGPLNPFLSYWDAFWEDCPSKNILKSLSIVDHWFRGPDAMFLSASTGGFPAVRGVCLEEFYFQSSVLSQPAALLSRYPDTKLRSLRVSAARGSPDFPSNQLADSYNAIQTLVRQHETTLKDIVLSDVWNAPDDLFQQLEACWEGQFAFTDLVLHWPPMKSNVVDENVIEEPLLSSCLWGFRGIQNRWGAQLLRICLGNISLDITEIDCLNDPVLAMLRVLILCPNTHDDQSVMTRNHNDNGEEAMAQLVAAKAPTSMRYLSVCDKVYWVTSGKLTDYGRAKITQRTEIQSWMMSEDLEFINPQSKWNQRCSSFKWHSDLIPGFDQVAEQNFLIARPVRNQDG